MMEILSLMEGIVKQIRELFQLFAPGQRATLDEIEAKVFSVMMEIGRLLIAKMLLHTPPIQGGDKEAGQRS